MRRTGIAELKGSLEEVLRTVQAGEEVLIIDQGQPIARISPVCSGGPSEQDIEELVKAGILRQPQVPMDEAFLEAFLSEPGPPDPEGSVLAALVAEREEDR